MPNRAKFVQRNGLGAPSRYHGSPPGLYGTGPDDEGWMGRACSQLHTLSSRELISNRCKRWELVPKVEKGLVGAEDAPAKKLKTPPRLPERLATGLAKSNSVRAGNQIAILLKQVATLQQQPAGEREGRLAAWRTLEESVQDEVVGLAEEIFVKSLNGCRLSLNIYFVNHPLSELNMHSSTRIPLSARRCWSAAPQEILHEEPTNHLLV